MDTFEVENIVNRISKIIVDGTALENGDKSVSTDTVRAEGSALYRAVKRISFGDLDAVQRGVVVDFMLAFEFAQGKNGGFDKFLKRIWLLGNK